jgi:hypothetical protein
MHLAITLWTQHVLQTYLLFVPENSSACYQEVIEKVLSGSGLPARSCSTIDACSTPFQRGAPRRLWHNIAFVAGSAIYIITKPIFLVCRAVTLATSISHLYAWHLYARPPSCQRHGRAILWNPSSDGWDDQQTARLCMLPIFAFLL